MLVINTFLKNNYHIIIEKFLLKSYVFYISIYLVHIANNIIIK